MTSSVTRFQSKSTPLRCDDLIHHHVSKVHEQEIHIIDVQPVKCHHACHSGLNIPEECFQNFFKTLEELKQFGRQKKVQPLTN